MSRKKFNSLKTTCGQVLEAGTVIRHIPKSWVEDGPHQPDHHHFHFIGSIIKIEQCDSGILLHCRTTQGFYKSAHVQYMHSLTYPSGVMLSQLDYVINILSRASQQMEIAA